jgi:hypothetical protein
LEELKRRSLLEEALKLGIMGGLPSLEQEFQETLSRVQT